MTRALTVEGTGPVMAVGRGRNGHRKSATVHCMAGTVLCALSTLSHSPCGRDVTVSILHGELRNREGKWLGQGHAAGSQHQAAWQSSGVAVFRFQSRLHPGQLLPSETQSSLL